MAVSRVTWEHSEPKNKPKSCYRSEDLPWVSHNILSSFFLDAECHSFGKNLPFYANIFCFTPFPDYSSCVNIKGSILPRDYAFYDNFIAPPSITKEPYSPNIRINYNGIFAGVLCPETQTLWATDWTHDACLREVSAFIIKNLYDLGYLKLVSEYQPQEEKEKVYEYPEYHISVGCDPEFELVDICEGLVRHASSDLGEGFYHLSENGNYGLDGAGDQVELRPNPGDPELVVANIKRLIEQFSNSCPNYSLSPSSDQFPCGGHIHIGIKPKPVHSFFDMLSIILDDFIGKPTKRLNGVHRELSYGSIGDWREQNHGMEYRTPPSTLYRNPEFARISLQLAFNLAWSFANTRELQYNSPISIEDLIEVGGLVKTDAELFFDQCINGAKPTSSECLLAAWEVEVKKSNFRVSIEFGEDWTPSVMNFVQEFVSHAKPSSNIRINMFGLMAKRGNVYTFKVNRRGIMKDHPSANNRSFGFSRKFRDGGESKTKMVQIMEKMFSILGIPLEKEK